MKEGKNLSSGNLRKKHKKRGSSPPFPAGPGLPANYHWPNWRSSPDMEAEEEADGCCDTHCSRCVYCCHICPKASVEEPHRPKCCGCKTKACVQLLSAFTVIAGLCIGASTILAYAEPCDVPLAPLMLTISSMFVWSGMLLFCLPEEWHRCGILTVTWCTMCWLVPANYCE